MLACSMWSFTFFHGFGCLSQLCQLQFGWNPTDDVEKLRIDIVEKFNLFLKLSLCVVNVIHLNFEIDSLTQIQNVLHYTVPNLGRIATVKHRLPFDFNSYIENS